MLSYTYNGQTWEFAFYGITGQRLATVMCAWNEEGTGRDCTMKDTNVYFGGKLIGRTSAPYGNTAVATDRLGSVRVAMANGWQSSSYYPYGEERTATPEGREKFGTYYRDRLGQDYADQRYYDAVKGRFWSPDPGGIRTAILKDPQSWNRYTYTRGDPVNRVDPGGLADDWPETLWSITVYGSFFLNAAPGSPGGENQGQRPMPWDEDLTKGEYVARKRQEMSTPNVPSSFAGTFEGAMKRVVEALKTSDCRSLFGTAESRSDGFDPSAVAAKLFGSGGTSTRIGSASVVTSFGPLGPLAPLGGTVSLGPVGVADIAVLINTSRLQGDDWDTAITLLHEMGHVYNAIPGAGGSPIQAGWKDVTGGYDDLIVDNCLTPRPIQ